MTICNLSKNKKIKKKEGGREIRGREGRGRRGGEKRKGLVIGGMVIGLLMGCNNGLAELEKENKFLTSISNLGKGFLSVFTDLGDMVSDVFGIKAETTKKDVGNYFTKIATTMESVKTKLQNEVSKNGNYEKVKTVVDKFIKGKLDVIIEGAKKAAKGATGEEKIGGATTGGGAVPADFASVNLLVNGIKEIVKVVLDGKGNSNETKTAQAQKQSIGKLLGQGSGTDGDETHAAAANASIEAVTGADILQAIAKSEEAANNTVQITNVKNAAEIAAAAMNSGQNLGESAQKDAVIAGGIALRAMAKSGKFAAKRSEEQSAHAVNGAAASAVGKTLSTLIIEIRRTVDGGLKTISETLAAVKQEDMSAEKSEGATK